MVCPPGVQLLLATMLAVGSLSGVASAGPENDPNGGAMPRSSVTSDQALGFAVDPLVVAELARAEIGAVVVAPDWPVAADRTGPVALWRIDVYAPEARIVALADDGEVEVPRSTRRYFLGESLDDPDVRILVSVDPETGDLGGAVLSGEREYELEGVEPGGTARRYALVSEDELWARKTVAPSPWSCGIDNAPEVSETALPADVPASTTKWLPTPHIAVIAVDTDNELMSLKFSNSTTAATAYIADIFARMNLIYERDLNVRLLQGQTFLRVDPDPYDVSTPAMASLDELVEFGNYWAANYSWVDRALVMMLSGKQDSPNTASGIAWLDKLCSTSHGYSFSHVFKVPYNHGDAGLIAHELGHNFGSHHTHCYPTPIDECWSRDGCYSGPESCPGGPGTLMSYCHRIGCGNNQHLFHPTVIAHLDGDTAWAAGVCLFADTEPPEISDAVAVPRITTAGSQITISATIVDVFSGVAAAEATVRDGGGSEVTALPMSNSSGDTWQAIFDSSGALIGTYTVDLWTEDTSDSANATTAVSAASFEIRSSFECDLELTGQSVADEQTWEACGSITAAPSFVIEAGGRASMTAGSRIRVRNEFSVLQGGELVLGVDPSLEQD